MRVSKVIKFFMVPILMLFALGIGANAATAEDLGGFGSDSGDGSSQTYNWDNQSSNGDDGNSTYDNGGSSDGLKLEENDDAGISEMLRNQHPVTKDSMARAQNGVAPLVRMISGFISLILVLLSVWIFAQTAIDLVYLVVPFSRGVLNPNMASSGAMGGGMGMGMGMGVGMGMGGAQVSGNGGKKWVSDEAEQALNEGQAGSVGAANGAMGMSMGVGMTPQQNKPKNVLGIYLKKRIGFMILFAICLIVLFCTVPLTIGTTTANTLVSWVSNFLGI